MTAKAKVGLFFKFEEDFVEANIRCIPMVVRFKLDACGIKLKLSEWSMMIPDERSYLAQAPCETAAEVSCYREHLYQVVASRTGNLPTPIPIPENPEWSRLEEIPYTIEKKLQALSVSCTVKQWQTLSDLQRFALLKLSYAGHEHKNFSKALMEFALMPRG